MTQQRHRTGRRRGNGGTLQKRGSVETHGGGAECVKTGDRAHGGRMETMGCAWSGGASRRSVLRGEAGKVGKHFGQQMGGAVAKLFLVVASRPPPPPEP